jgi:hypothetical protein
MKFYSDQPIIDKLGRVIAVVAPPPRDASYIVSTERACKKMKQELSQIHLNPIDQIDPKRGDGYFALNVGLSYGNGHTKPSNRDLGAFQGLADALLGDVDIQRLASYQDGKFYLFWKHKADVFIFLLSDVRTMAS